MIDYGDWTEKPTPEIDPESEEYWAAANDGELVVQHCADCSERQLYPRRLCRNCWSRDLAFEAVEGTGTLYSFSRNHVRGQPGYDEETPYVVALVELDLPAENPSGRPVRMTSHVVDCEYEDLSVDQPLEVDFRRISENPKVHLPVFRPQE